MISYRFKRRSFITAMGGGLGLKVMFRNLELSAQTMRSAGRLLVTHWPVGIVAGSNNALWTPTSGSVGGSPGLQPFADAGLGPDMTVLRGISTPAQLSGGGSHEGGTVVLVTGIAAPGTRTNRTEGDDSFSGGPSFDQILLNNVPALKSPMGGTGFANSIADSRTDFAEVSTKCLSYSASKQSVTLYSGGTGMENIPLSPILSPLQQYTSLFQNFIPGGTGTGGSGTGGSGTGGRGTGGSGTGGSGTGGSGAGTGGRGGNGGATPRVADAMLRQLACKRSVLDFAIEELNQMKGMVPNEGKNKVSIHTDAITSTETFLTSQINQNYPGLVTGTGGSTGTGGQGTGTGGRGGSGTGTGGRGGSTGTGGQGTGGSGVVIPTCGGRCATKPAEPAATAGPPDPMNGAGNSYGNDGATTDDATTHMTVGKAHLEVLKAAFVCDLIRVGTYQWSPGTNHVAFKGLYPGNANGIFQHHPVSHRIGTAQTIGGATAAALDANAGFLYAVQRWYFQKHAENFATWKTQMDGCGNSLLDFTVVPFVTEVRATGHERTDMPAMIIGGKSLGFTHNIYRTGAVSINQFWGTIGQALGYTSTATPFAAPISGLWTRPA